MKLYVCWGTFRSPRPGGHPCRNAHEALREAGWNPEVEKVYGCGILGDSLNPTRARSATSRAELGARSSRPTTARSSRAPTSIAKWARDNPASGADRAA